MELKHIALVSSTEENADRFYMEVLGLKKGNKKTIPAALSSQLFKVNSELKIINYACDNIHVEIFIRDAHHAETAKAQADRIDHVCLAVDNLEAFLETCRKMRVVIARVPKGDAIITFIQDYDGNLFEIKQV